MCGRFIQISNPEKITVKISDLQVKNSVQDGFTPRYNIAPTQAILTVMNSDPPELAYTRWGLIPFWAKDPSIGSRMINARAETLLTKSSFKVPFRKRRCLIFSDGFYEWRSEGRSKVPFLVRMKSAEPFAMAGLWDQWTDPATDSRVVSSTIITTSANELVSTIHDRMPAILKQQDYPVWLNPGSVPDEVLMGCIYSFPSDAMEAFEVSKLVNNPAFDMPECIAPLA